MKKQRWLALGLSILMVATSTPAWAVPTLAADEGTEQVTSSSETTEASDDAAAAAETETTSETIDSAVETDESVDQTDSETETDAAVENDEAADPAAVEESEDTVAQSSLSEDVSDSSSSTETVEDTDDEDDQVAITFDANGGQKWYGDDEESKQTVWTETHSINNSFWWWSTNPFYLDHVFLGWSKDKNATEPEYKYGDYDVTVPSEDTTLYAVWTEGVTVIFDSNNGSDEKRAYSYEKGTTFNDAHNWIFDRDGYCISGWSVNQNATEPDDGYSINDMSSTTVPQADTTLYAVWANTVEITFNANDGQRNENDTETSWTEEYIDGGTFGYSEDAYKEDGVLLGWSASKDATTPEYKINEMSDAAVPADGTTLYAVWAEASIITYDANGGQWYEGDDEYATAKTWTEKYIAGGTFEWSEGAYRKGYQLLGWSANKDAETPEYKVDEMGDASVPADGTILYAVWAREINITLDGNGGLFDEDKTYAITALADVSFNVYVEPSRKGYWFLGWSTKKDAKEPELTDSDNATFSSDTTLYAVWEKANLLTFDGNGGIVNSEKTYYATIRAGQTYNIPSAERENYVLSGWEDSDGNFYLPSTQLCPEKDMTFKAVWASECTIRMYANVEESEDPVYTQTAAKGSRCYISNGAFRDGYLFLGWSTDKNATTPSVERYSYLDVTGDVNLYAVWAPASSGYTVTLDMNGGMYDGKDSYNVVVEKGKIVDAIPDFSESCSRDGYYLMGWSFTKDGDVAIENISTYVPTADVTLYAVWNPECTITLKYGDSDKYTISCGKGNYISSYYYIPSVMEVDGNETAISGWKDEKTGEIYSRDQLLTTPVKEDRTYVAQSDNSSICKVTLIKNDGSDDKKVVSVKKGTTLYSTVGQSDFYRNGYIIFGWSEDSKADKDKPDTYYCLSDPTVQSFVVTKDMTLYAVWGPYCSITFDANGGTMTANGESTLTTDKDYWGYIGYSRLTDYYTNASRDCEREGYAFVGWSTNKEGKEVGEGFTARGESSDKYLYITENTTLYAIWQKGNTITLNYNGGLNADNSNASVKCQIPSGKTFSESYELETIDGNRNGYLLEGWSKDKNAAEPQMTSSELADYKPSKNEVWYAVWTPVKSGKTHKVFFYVNGGYASYVWPNESLIPLETCYQANIPNGRSIDEMMNLNGSDYNLKCVRDGYVLAGWSKQPDAKTADFKTAEELGAFKPTEDTALYAVWKPLTLKLNTKSVTLKRGRKYTLKFTSFPKYAWDGTEVVDEARFSTNNWSVVTIDPYTGEITARAEGQAVVTAFCAGQSFDCVVTVEGGGDGIIYKSHVQNKGTLDWVEDGAVSGTTGQNLRMEALYLDLADESVPGSVEYRSHVQNIGWQDWSANGALSGTEGKGLRVEAVQIRLTGEMADKYDIYYCVHAQNYGWLNWAKNGESSGTSGFGYRLEAIRVKLVKKGVAAPAKLGTDSAAYHEKNASVTYMTHVQDYGDQKWVSDGAMSGTEGKSKRMEAVYIKLTNQSCTGDIEYQSHVQDYGWETEWKKNGELSGTTGKSKRVEAIRIRLTGEMAEKYDIYYCVHAQNYGWLNWAKNGESAGTAGFGYRLEALRIRLVRKGGAAPSMLGTDGSAFHEKNAAAKPSVIYKSHVQDYGDQEWVSDGQLSGTEGKSKRMEAIYINLASQPYTGNIEYQSHVQDYGWEKDWKKNGALSGTEGESKRLEAIRIRLTGEMAKHYDIYYRVHAQNFGWLGWAKNGANAGTAGYSYRLEAIQIKIVPKGQAAPGSTANTFKQK